MTEQPTLPSLANVPPVCIKSSGPASAKLMIVGEAPGAEEEKQGLPFVGSSGQELRRMLSETAISDQTAYFTNVFHRRPPNNNLSHFFGQQRGPLPSLQVEGKVRHLVPDLHSEILRLWQEIASVGPNLILALGNTALWALTGSARISAMRGTILQPSSAHLENIVRMAEHTGFTAAPMDVGSLSALKLLPTYHPSAVLRDWSLRPIVLSDLLKAHRQMQFPEVRRPKRQIWINPTLSKVQAFSRLITRWPSGNRLLSCDIETRLGQITEIGFAWARDRAIVIPLIRDFKDHYWSEEDEIEVHRHIGLILSSPVPKIFQNGLYDLQYILRYGWRPSCVLHDTMLKHHSMYPELQKGLGFLGSIYTDEPAWKLMRTKAVATTKRDDE